MIKYDNNYIKHPKRASAQISTSTNQTQTSSMIATSMYDRVH